jgi:hypothetical protein
MQENLTFNVRPEDMTANFIPAKCRNSRDALILCVECSDKTPLVLFMNFCVIKD